MKKFTLFALTLLATVSAGCSDSGSSKTIPDDFEWVKIDQGESSSKDITYASNKLAITKANSCDDYRSHLLDALAKDVAENRFRDVGYYYHHDWIIGGVDDVDKSESFPNDSAPSSPGSNSSSAGEFTTTNVQEAGVDELDTVKNDSKYMYAIRDNQIHITQIWPAEEMKEIAVIERNIAKNENGNSTYYSPRGILLSGDRLIDIEQAYTYNYNNYYHYWYGNYSNLVSVRVFDVSDPANPQLIKNHQLEGSFEDARLIDGRLHMISTANSFEKGEWFEAYTLSKEEIPGVPRFVTPWSENYIALSDEDYNNWKAESDNWLDQYEENMIKYLPVIRAWLDKRYPTIDNFNWPQYNDGENTRNAIACEDLYIPGTSSTKTSFLLMSEISGEDFDQFKASAITDYGWLVYASAKNLYVVSNSSSWYWDYDYSETAHIHHFNLGNADGQVKYVNSGSVDGYVENSFWMSEYNDHLRVVSERGSWWTDSKDGHLLSIFDINTPTVMQTTGKLEGFGANENIYAARMFGNKGYAVTFRRTDPLYTFDLSDPTNPQIKGELKINGYSSYIHPVGENHLLTIGENADDNGSTTGMHLQLFDVSDLSNPVRKYHTMITNNESDDNGYSYGWSEALHNHHAINYHAGSGLLAIPVSISSWTYNDWDYSYFSGMFVYRVTPETDFEFLGGVDHSDLKPSNYDNDYYDYYWWTDVNRARFYFKDAGVYDQNAYVYTISNRGIKASDANHPDTTIKSVVYEPNKNEYGYIY